MGGPMIEDDRLEQAIELFKRTRMTAADVARRMRMSPTSASIILSAIRDPENGKHHGNPKLFERAKKLHNSWPRVAGFDATTKAIGGTDSTTPISSVRVTSPIEIKARNMLREKRERVKELEEDIAGLNAVIKLLTHGEL